MKAAGMFVLIALIAGVLLGATGYATAPRIAANQAAKAANIRAELIGSAEVTTQISVCDLQARGYAGTIALVLGVRGGDTGGTDLVGVRVTRHSETPGIGDFIDRKRSAWIDGFSEPALAAGFYSEAEPARLRALDAHLDAVSGASITRRAVLRAVAQGCSV